MKLNKKAFSIIEILIYITIIAFVGFSSYIIMDNIIKKLDTKNKRNIFYKNYNNFVSDIIKNVEKEWKLDSILSSWIILKNNGKYFWYACTKNGIYKTYITNISWSIDWNSQQTYFSWFRCNEIIWTGNIYSWYWIKVNILDNKTFQYFLKN